MDAIDTGSRKRNVAYKVRIGDLLHGTPVSSEGRFIHLDTGLKKIVRINIIANCIDKYISEGERKFGSLTIDDASGQIRIKVFGDDTNMIEEILQGDTLQIVGNVREWNNEIYIIPEVLKKIDSRWLLVRKFEIQDEKKEIPADNSNNLKDKILNLIKDAEIDGGIDIEKITSLIESNPNSINEQIKKLLEDGVIYEPRPGRIRYLG
jgi:RPA family protein